jgi:hypothetical protein
MIDEDASITMRRNFQPLFSGLDAEQLKRRFLNVGTP